MLVRIENVKSFAPGEMQVFDVAGTKVNVASVGGQLHAFDDKCTHKACSLAKASWTVPLWRARATAVNST